MPSNTTNQIASFVKYNRNKLHLTQQGLAEKAGVGLRFIRDLEQGKETLRLDKVNQVLQLFGYTAAPLFEKIIDPYYILLNYINQQIRIHLKDKTMRAGIILGQITENNAIKAWRFVDRNNTIKYQKTGDPKLEENIIHANIEEIESATL